MTNRHRKYYLENKDHLKKQSKIHYEKNRDKILERAKKHREVKRKLINEVCLSYGCKNPECKWEGEFHSAQLEFHHFDPKKKQFQMGRGADYGYKSVANEMNKCVVLCACCHALYHVGLVDLDETMLCSVNDDLQILNEGDHNDE